MSESGYYPAGAENDSNAPYNQKDTEYKPVEVTVSTSLSKNTRVFVDDYTATEWRDYDIDDDGRPYLIGGIDYNYDDCNLEKAYDDGDMYRLSTLLDKLVELCDNKLTHINKGIHNLKEKNCSIPKKLMETKKYWEKMRQSAEGWVEDEFEVNL